jgi:outer membrane protein assembly factor BamB
MHWQFPISFREHTTRFIAAAARGGAVPALVLLAAAWSPAASYVPGDWPSFRGYQASGIADGPAPPVDWDIASGKNVRWRTPIPGLGHASPIVRGNSIFVVTAISGKPDPELKVGLYGNIAPVEDDTVHRWLLLALDKRDGKIQWQRVLHEGVPKIKRHTKASHANATPAAGGDRVVVMLGSEGLHCYTQDGEHCWSKDLGVLDSGYYVVPPAQWGFAASPAIHQNRVIVQCDVQKDSFIAAFALADGKQLWRTPRGEVPTWSTPTVWVGKGIRQVIVNGYRHIGGYDLDTGAEIWRMRGGGDIPVPTPVVAHGLAYITNAHGPGAPLYAIRPSATGDISLDNGETSNAHIAWSVPRNGAYMQTPLVVGDHVYSCTDSGILACYDAKTGKRIYRERLGSGGAGFTASPVAHGENLYFTSEEGDVYVIRAGATFGQVAQASLDEVCMATPAVSEGVIYFRTRRHLVAIGE